MRRIEIRNLGPISSANIELKRRNVIIGPQSSGKSCVLKTACYCVWVEKRIELAQSEEYFRSGDNFIKELERFHKLYGYIQGDTYIAYESEFMSFSYDNSSKEFRFSWQLERLQYRRTKVSYIPAERNMVAAIPNWFDVKLADDNIRSFMSDWETARRATTDKLDVLNLGVSYHYDNSSRRDNVLVDQTSNALALDLTNTSSGLQSLIPLFVHLNYLKNIHKHQEVRSVIQSLEEKDFLEEWGAERVVEYINQLLKNYSHHLDLDEQIKEELQKEIAEEINKQVISIRENYQNYHHCDIFLEEPESNLFPPTQSVLVHWLRTMTEGEHASNLFVATHSPYILTAFLEEKDDRDLAVFLVQADGVGSEVITASETELGDIYDCGIDAFFNIEFFSSSHQAGDE